MPLHREFDIFFTLPLKFPAGVPISNLTEVNMAG